MVKRSKKYREAAEKVDRNNLYTANEAIALLKSMPAYNFDQTVEAVYRLRSWIRANGRPAGPWHRQPASRHW